MTVTLFGIVVIQKDCFGASLLAMTVTLFGIVVIQKDCFGASLLAMTVTFIEIEVIARRPAYAGRRSNLSINPQIQLNPSIPDSRNLSSLFSSSCFRL